MDDFASPTNINWRGHVGQVEYGGGDRNMVVIFFNKALHNPAKSASSGRPIYEDVIYVRIHPPGERLNIVERPANDSDRRRFPGQYQQFLQQKEQITEGTPVDLLFPDHPSVGAMLRAHGIHTVEQCADLSANAIENIGMGAQRYVNMAVNYLKAAQKGVNAIEYRKTIDSLQQEVKILTQQNEQLKAQIDAVLRNTANNQNTVEQIIGALQGGLGRPVHMPGVGFDAAMAQINATHPTREMSQSRKPDKTKPRRVRATLRG